MKGKLDGTVLPVLISAALLAFAITTTFTVVQAAALKATRPGEVGTKASTVGPGTSAKDCSYGGVSYSKGSVIQQADGKNYRCTGDDDGSWELAR